MESWEFLLQKEGDRAWLPLESPDVEILEGRYRVVARSNCPNTDIEIRVSHQPEEMPSQRRVQKRSTRTNPEGLIVVIPYTRLKPGIWELCCLVEGRLESGNLKNSTVQLQVLPVESDLVEELEPDRPTPQEPDVTAVAVQNFAESSDREATVAIAEVATPSTMRELLPTQPSNRNESSLNSSQTSPFTLHLVLDRDNFVTQLGDPLTISGRVEVADIAGHAQNLAETTTEQIKRLIQSLQLYVILRDPQTSEALVEISQSLPARLPPCIFACIAYLPAECKTRLILGEVILSDGKTVLDSQPFTIAARVEQLLEVIEENFSEQDHQTPSAEALHKQSEAAVNQSFLNLLNTLNKEGQPSDFLVSANQPIPPQIGTRPATGSGQGLELPSFGRKLPTDSEVRSEVASSLEAIVHPSTPAPLGDVWADTPDEVVQSPLASSALEASSAEAATHAEANRASEVSSEKVDEKVGSATPQVTQAFRSLKLENRFWSRLSALATDMELSQWLQKEQSPPATPVVSPELSVVSPPEAVTPSVTAKEESVPAIEEEPAPSPSPVRWEDREVVVFDDPPTPTPPPKSQPVLATVVEAVERTPYVLPEEAPIPVPILDILGGEVVAGRGVKIRVRLPELLPRIYVKVWVYDRQSYVILDGPRWITELFPNGFGGVEGTAELELGYGCLDVEFEAIAVEMQTMRESDKVTVYRQVTSPPAPLLPLEEES